LFFLEEAASNLWPPLNFCARFATDGGIFFNFWPKISFANGFDFYDVLICCTLQ